jgi:hypothetical protein
VVFLGIDVDAHIRVGVEQLVEPHGFVRAADSGLAHRFPRQLGDRAGPVRHALEGGVVEREDHAVACEPGVGLEIAVSERDRVTERHPGVLGVARGPASVGERDRSRVVEKRQQRHRPGTVSRR